MKFIDQIYSCRIAGQVFGAWNLKGHLRIFQPHAEVQTVLLTDMGFNMSWFVPYVTEELINRVVYEFDLDFADLVWIEHYTFQFRRPACSEFSQVTFDWQEGNARYPKWQAITPQVAQVLIGEDYYSDLLFQD